MKGACEGLGLASLVGLLWPDASQDSDSDIARLLQLGKEPHSGVWTRTPAQGLPLSLARLFDPRTLNQINAGSSLIAAVLAVLLIATAPEEFAMPECTNTMEAAGLEGPHRWGIILPNSSRVSLLTYKAVVGVRYPELVLHDQDPIQIGHFVAHDNTVEYGGFRTVLWDAPKDLRTAVEDVVNLLTYLQRRHRDLSQGATAQLLVLCNRTAVHNQLLQHGFQTAWLDGCGLLPLLLLLAPQPVLQLLCKQSVAFLVEGEEVPLPMTERIAMDERQWR